MFIAWYLCSSPALCDTFPTSMAWLCWKCRKTPTNWLTFSSRREFIVIKNVTLASPHKTCPIQHIVCDPVRLYNFVNFASVFCRNFGVVCNMRLLEAHLEIYKHCYLLITWMNGCRVYYVVRLSTVCLWNSLFTVYVYIYCRNCAIKSLLRCPHVGACLPSCSDCRAFLHDNRRSYWHVHKHVAPMFLRGPAIW